MTVQVAIYENKDLGRHAPPRHGFTRERPSLSFICFFNADKDGPNFHCVEIDRYWDRLDEKPWLSASLAWLTTLPALAGQEKVKG
jgi:hypothetical protein